MVCSKEERPIELVRVVESLCGLELVAEKSSSTKKEKCNSRKREREREREKEIVLF